ncbi:hypothetical protein PENTCL1PPCAC_24685, partial [Pristionchus entomophagus]
PPAEEGDDPELADIVWDTADPLGQALHDMGASPTTSLISRRPPPTTPRTEGSFTDWQSPAPSCPTPSIPSTPTTPSGLPSSSSSTTYPLPPATPHRSDLPLPSLSLSDTPQVDHLS